mmetsp:Transcript_13495/g.42476  ORF Transcript_13495/g.42476 Transcript_13495/m.42476 type:complete len:87 (-) Transcript_13495:238-498(-)
MRCLYLPALSETCLDSGSIQPLLRSRKHWSASSMLVVVPYTHHSGLHTDVPSQHLSVVLPLNQAAHVRLLPYRHHVTYLYFSSSRC